MSIKLKEHYNDFLFLALGGANEIGMNLNLYHYQGKWLMVDFGIGFAEGGWLPGVDVVVPDVTFLREIRNEIVGLIITHAHEDHLGAAPYLWEELTCPVYATPFTAALLRGKLAREGITTGKSRIKEVANSATLHLDPFSVELIGLTHSVPEMHAIAIGTKEGVVMHTGDWKFDPEPMVGAASDEAALARYGDEGVLAMVCDSTNVFVKGHSGSEGTVRKNLVKHIAQCEGRVVVTTFASNVARLETIIEAAKEAGRKIVLSGRSLWRVTEAAREAGYLPNVEFLPEEKAKDLARHDLLVICTGCQGEPLASLPKIARGDNPHIKLIPGDTVFFSARMIPGNEKRINHMQNGLIRAKIEVITDSGDEIHVSGHPARDELAKMYTLVRPYIALPVHGEARHIHEHAKLAKSLQVPVAIEPYNGAVIRLNKDRPGIIGEVQTGYIAIDGDALLDVNSPVLKMRRRMQEAGVICVSVVVDDAYMLVAEPSVHCPGSLDEAEDSDLLETLREEIEEVIENLQKPSMEKTKQAIRTVIRRIFKRDIGKKPVILVDVMMV